MAHSGSSQGMLRLTSLVVLLVTLSVWLVLLLHFNADAPVVNINYYDVISELFSIAFVLLLLGVNLRLNTKTSESFLMFIGFCCMLVGDGHDLIDEFVLIDPDWISLLFENVATNLGIVIIAIAIFRWSGKYQEQLRLLKKQKKILTDASNTDPLTKLHNRRYLNNEFIQKMLTGKHNTIRTLLLLDLDRFKAVNDTYGHLVGDKLIVNLAEVIRSEIREQDFAFRFGGEEFLVVLDGNREIGHRVAERIREEYEDSPFQVNDRELAKTTSIGLFELPHGMSFEKALDIADKALYQAKESGRNRVVEGSADLLP